MKTIILTNEKKTNLVRLVKKPLMKNTPRYLKKNYLCNIFLKRLRIKFKVRFKFKDSFVLVHCTKVSQDVALCCW